MYQLDKKYSLNLEDRYKEKGFCACSEAIMLELLNTSLTRQKIKVNRN